MTVRCVFHCHRARPSERADAWEKRKSLFEESRAIATTTQTTHLVHPQPSSAQTHMLSKRTTTHTHTHTTLYIRTHQHDAHAQTCARKESTSVSRLCLAPPSDCNERRDIPCFFFWCRRSLVALHYTHRHTHTHTHTTNAHLVFCCCPLALSHPSASFPPHLPHILSCHPPPLPFLPQPQDHVELEAMLNIVWRRMDHSGHLWRHPYKVSRARAPATITDRLPPPSSPPRLPPPPFPPRRAVPARAGAPLAPGLGACRRGHPTQHLLRREPPRCATPCKRNSFAIHPRQDCAHHPRPCFPYP